MKLEKSKAVTNKKNILIYDERDIFIKLVKHYCGSNIDVTFCSKKEEINKIDLVTYNSAFMVINQSIDMGLLLDIYKNVNELYINTNSIFIKKKINQLEGAHFFDLKRDKLSIMNKIFDEIIDFN